MPGTNGQPPDASMADLLGRCLRAVGAVRVFGAPDSGIVVSGLGHALVEEPAEAAMLADADGRLGAGAGVALLPGRRLRLSSAPGARVEPITISDPAELPGAVASWSWGQVHTAVELVIDLDLAAPPPTGLEPLQVDQSASQALALSPDMRDIGMVVLAGPGVIRAGAVDALAAFARQAGCGVFNTFGAKGLFAWNDPHHLGTIGLQRDDVELAGLAEAPVVITVGVDPAELAPHRWQGPAVLEVEPSQLATLALRWPSEPPSLPGRPELYQRLAALLAPSYVDDSVPLHPARAVKDLAEAAGDDAVVVADPGPAGFWVARALPTQRPGSVVVPAHPAPGFAMAAAMVASLSSRRSIAVLTGPLDPLSEALVQRAEAWRTDAVLVCWGADAPFEAADDHAVALREALDADGLSVVGVPVDLAATKALIDAAGPVVSWTPESYGDGPDEVSDSGS